MTGWICHYCSYIAQNYNELNTHELEAHNLFKGSDVNITEETISKLRSTMSKVKWILETNPSARGDDRILVLIYLRVFEQHLVYNEATKKIEFRNKEGIDYETWRSLSSFETLTRCRRKCQENFPELKPSELVQIKRAKRAEIIRTNIKTLTHNQSEYNAI